MPRADEHIAQESTAREAARALAAVIGIAALPLNEIPDKDVVARMETPEFTGALKAVSQDDAFDECVREGAALMLGYLEDASTKAINDVVVDLGVDRTKVYRGISPEYGPPYPCEAVWRGLDGVDAARFVEQLVSQMRASGGAPVSGAERPDYLGMELQFARFLLEQGVRQGEADCERALQGCARFCNEHLAWVADYVQAAMPYATTSFIRGHLIMLEGLSRQLSSIAP